MLDTIGSTPRGAVRTISLACRNALRPWREYAWLSACSGGTDSLAMTIVAAELAHRWQIPFSAVIVNHGMRPEAAHEANQAAQELQRWEIPARILTPDQKPGEQTNAGLEAHARQVRYQLLARAATEMRQHSDRPVVVLLGHTMDDQAETVLLGLAHGAGARSLAGMPPWRTQMPIPHSQEPLNEASLTWVRPLLQVRRAHTQSAINQLQAHHVEDPTNAPNGPWRRADGGLLPRLALRYHALPALADALGKDPVPALARTAQHLQEDNAYLETQARALLEEARIAADTYRVNTLQGAAPALRRRALVNLISSHCGGRPHHRQVADVDRLITDYHGQGAINLNGGGRCWRERTQTGQAVIKILTRCKTVRN